MSIESRLRTLSHYTRNVLGKQLTERIRTNEADVEGTYATGAIKFLDLPLDTETLVINGVTVTFKDEAVSFPDIQIAAETANDIAATVVNLATALNAEVDDPLLNKATYTASGDTLKITYITKGEDGNEFTIDDGTFGAGADLSGATLDGGTDGLMKPVHGTQASGYIVLHTVPTEGETIVLNGITVTFTEAPGAFPDVLIRANLPLQMVTLVAKLNEAVDAELTVATYSGYGGRIDVVYDTPGLVGNTYTLDAGTADATASGTTLTGGTDGSANSLLAKRLDTTVTYNADGTLGDVAGLSVNVEAATKYEIELVLHSVAAVKSLLLDFGGTATITGFIGQWTAEVADGDETDAVLKLRVTAAGTDFGGASIGAGNNVYTFKGSMLTNAAGTFLPRGAQETSDVSNTTILAGSTLKLTRCA
jgi:hypothetical protein